ncbi:MAG: type II secretion system F family protein [Candidatus Micrarchaeota archaeon]
MFESICNLVYLFPKIRFNTKNKTYLRLVRPDIDFEKYNGMNVIIAWISSLITYILTETVEIAFIVLIFAFYFIWNLPKMELDKRKSRIETELPFFLRNFGMLIEIGIPFTRAMELSSSGYRSTKKELQIVLNKVNTGLSMQKALSELGILFNSTIIKRAVSQLILLYETGGSGKEIKKVGDDILSFQQHRLKEYSAKSSIFGLVFVMTSAILPTFFIVYAITGSIGFGTKINQMQMAIALLVIFPAISALLLLLSKTTMPSSIFTNSKWFEWELLLPGILIITGTFLFDYKIIFFAAGLVVGVYLTIKNFNYERRIEQIESEMPDALFVISSMPGSSGVDLIFETIKKGDLGNISNEFGIAKKQLDMNIKTDIVIEDLVKRNRSELFRQMLVMMKQMIETNSLAYISSLAEDIIKHIEIKRERSQLLATQKYTLIMGTVIVPIILRTVINLIETMESVVGPETVREVITSCGFLVPPYLIVYVSMVSIAIADSEGKKSSASLYLVVLSILSLASFYFINL